MTITVTPADYSSAHGDLYYNVSDTKASDPATYPDYKYLADIYIDGTLIASLKAVPHPVSKKGIFNIGSIVRNYVGIRQLDFLIYNPDKMYLANNIFYAKVQVKFGEEYDLTLTTNIVVDTERKFYNTYNGRLLGVDTILQDYLSKFATTRPLDSGNKARINSNHFYIPYISRIADWTHYEFINDVGYSFSGDFLPGEVGELIQLDISPVVFNLLASSVSSVGVSDTTEWYTFQVDNGPIIKINIYCENINPVYTVHFVNRFGGLESFEFSKKSISKLDIESKGIGILRANTDGSTYNGSVVNDNFKTYYTRYTEKLTLNSDHIKQGHYKWLAEMVLSPQKWIEEGSMLVPIRFTNTSYEFKTRVNDKSNNTLMVEVDFNEDLNTQYL